MPETLIKPVVPSFETIEEMRFGLAQKGRATDLDLYPRDGSKKLSEAEAHAARLAGVGPDQMVLLNTGMTAISNTLEVAVRSAGNTSPVIACAREAYSKTNEHLGEYAAAHGLKLVRFDSGYDKDIDRLFETHQPDIIISETVGNGPNVPVLNHEYLLQSSRLQEKQPIIILDHTLPLSTGYDVFGSTTEDDKVFVVESGTKSYTLNRETVGLAYSKNLGLIDALRALRCRQGGLPGVGSIDMIASLLPESRQAFDDRNQRIFASTGALALKLYEASQREGSDFMVAHPALPEHDNYNYSAAKNNGNITPVFFLQCLNFNQFELAARIGEDREVRKYAELSQSFGFDTARILPDMHAPVVRIAGGAYTDTEKLGAALYEASLKK